MQDDITRPDGIPQELPTFEQLHPHLADYLTDAGRALARGPNDGAAGDRTAGPADGATRSGSGDAGEDGSPSLGSDRRSWGVLERGFSHSGLENDSASVPGPPAGIGGEDLGERDGAARGAEPTSSLQASSAHPSSLVDESTAAEDAPEGVSSVLLSGHNPTEGGWVEWTRQQKRAYHRALSCLNYWCEHGYQVRWVVLTTAVGGESKRLSYHHQRLLLSIARKLGFAGVEFCKAITDEGNGVIHLFWAWKGGRTFWVPQKWLSIEWARIHGASYVWIKPVKTGKSSRRRLSRYIVTQYLAGQDALVRVTYSWGRTFGFPLVAVWNEFKRRTLPRARVALWHCLLSGERVMWGNGETWTLGSVRQGWGTYARGRAETS